MKTVRIETADRFAALRAAITSDEIRAAIGGLTDDLQELVRAHSEAELVRDRAILEGGDATALRNRVITLATEIADLRMAIEAAATRQAEAESREQDTETQDLRAAAERLSAQLGETYRRFDASLMVTREEHATADREKAELDRLNESLAARGHPELRVKPANVRRDALGSDAARVFPGLTRNAQRRDALLRDLATPGMAIRINPRHRQFGSGVTPHSAA